MKAKEGGGGLQGRDRGKAREGDKEEESWSSVRTTLDLLNDFW